ncbi:TetR/AcrR family transcriptional regulator [Fulvivirga ligni]|uniref:TetR/AcrR family transcriptional regulator n=1 Tax=Fulvivirga ligni TaxID=2904246 RepID=UPI001F268D9C|nr:TetR/AcrR family transcriptional regulator [Fulvivirga ligni]UII22409.1 TetR/AcrR family transcriptional regulator [Fulvivirga ligni]
MNTREKIVKLARREILKVGYKGFSFHDISSPLRIKNAAVHYYFPTKEDLGLEVIDNEIQRFISWFEDMADLSHWQKLEAFFELYDGKLTDEQMCMVGSLCSSYFSVTENIQAKLKEMMDHIKNWLSGLLAEGSEEGSFSFIGSANDKALVILTSLAAGVQMARAVDEDYFTPLKHQLRLELNINSHE